MIMVYGPYVSVVALPFILAIFGFRSSEKSVLIGMAAASIMFIAWEMKLMALSITIDSCAPALLTNAVFLFGSHYLLRQPGGWVGIKDKQSLASHKRIAGRQRKEVEDMIFGFNFKQFLASNMPRNENIYHLVGFISAFLVMVNAISIKFTFARHLQPYDSNLIVTLSAIAWTTSTLFIVYPVMRPAFKNLKIVPFCWTAGIFIAMICIPTAFLILSNFAAPQLIVFATYIIGLTFLLNWATALSMIASGIFITAIAFQNHLVLDQTEQVQMSLAFVMLTTTLVAFARPLQNSYAAQERRYNKSESEKADMLEALQNFSIMKQELLNNLSHEIRTPMHHIGAGIEAIHKDWDKYSMEQLKELSEISYQGYQNAIKYIDNLLDFSNLSANKVSLHLAEKDFVSLVKSSVAKFKQMYLQNSNLQIDLSLEEDALLVNCDEEKIKKVIMSLLENALQYGEKSLIEISVSKGQMHGGKSVVRFSISDFGLGIPENELASIFGPFVQSSHTKKMSGGKGIGLALCEKIITMHNGKIWAQNNIGRSGATFSFIIPV
jgi:signal transduction histidine kinase